MKPLSDQNHYEILEVARDAPFEQLERAFRMAESTYADDSLAGYSVFGEGEAEAIRERVSIACALGAPQILVAAWGGRSTRALANGLPSPPGPSSNPATASVRLRRRC